MHIIIISKVTNALANCSNFRTKKGEEIATLLTLILILIKYN
jgi:hypothetical protein